jgi:thiol-disulfide isomerase/thioredoxin
MYIKPANISIHVLILAFNFFVASTATAGVIQEIDLNITPPLSLNDLQDRPHTLDDYRGRVVLVNFWASWCPPCIQEMPAMKRLARDMKDHPFDILALNVGEKKYQVYKFTGLVNFDLPVLLDHKQTTFNAWHVKTLPTSFLLDATGKIRYYIQGDPHWDDAKTRAIINKLIDEAVTSHPPGKSTRETTDEIL